MRWGVLFLIFLFFALLSLRTFLIPEHIDGQTVSSAYGLEVREEILPEDSPLRTGIKRQIKYIVIHETANLSPTANAEAHCQYLLRGGDGTTAWHYTVDEKIAYHHIPDDEIAYHAGKKGNTNGIGIEICVNDGGDFEKAFENCAKLTAKLIDIYGLSEKDIRQHADFMDKNCPQTIRDGNRWNEFLELVKVFLK